jgi:2-polyprenyl-3-methyl-5-hydroxy-6-metoxy-1,4-benzoquinol methylase
MASSKNKTESKATKMTLQERLKRKNKFDANLVIGVRQFNLATGRDVHLGNRERQKTSESLINPKTGLIYNELSRRRNCPICNLDGGSLLFVKDGFRHLRCNECQMVYVSPILKEERLHSFYQDEVSFTKVLLNDLQIRLDKKKFKYGLDLIEEFTLGRGRLLDIGCGPGTFLEVAIKYGWKVQGVEFNSWCVQHLRHTGIEVIDVPLEQAQLPENTYHCITMWNVLEHISDPKNLLKQIHKLLVPHGILLIKVPNIDSLVVRILHEKAVTFAGDSHINFFNGDTLSRLLKETGYEVQECETILTGLGTINNYLDFQDPYFGEGKTALDFLTPEYIHENMLGYQLLTLASKISK